MVRSGLADLVVRLSRATSEDLAKRLRKAAAADDPFAVFNSTQDHLLAAAEAHVDRVLLEAFVAGIDSCPDPVARELLGRVCDLYVLSAIEAQRAWFIEHGRLSAARTRQLSRVVNDLCGALRPNARALLRHLAYLIGSSPRPYWREHAREIAT